MNKQYLHKKAHIMKKTHIKRNISVCDIPVRNLMAGHNRL